MKKTLHVSTIGPSACDRGQGKELEFTFNQNFNKYRVPTGVITCCLLIKTVLYMHVSLVIHEVVIKLSYLIS